MQVKEFGLVNVLVDNYAIGQVVVADAVRLVAKAADNGPQFIHTTRAKVLGRVGKPPGRYSRQR